MSASKKREAAVKIAAEQNSDTGLNDENVREYLKNHDDFLQRYPDMLDYLHVSHASGSAISLVEKQVSVLRERNTEIRQRLKTLTANAKDNDMLYEQTRAQGLRILAVAQDTDERLVRQYMVNNAYRFPVAMDGGQVRSRLTSRRVIPMTCAIDRQGRLVQAIPGEMFEEDLVDLARGLIQRAA